MDKKLGKYIRTKFDEEKAINIETIYEKELHKMLQAEQGVLSKSQFKAAKGAILNRIAMYKAFKTYIDDEKAAEYSKEFMMAEQAWFKNFTKFMTAGKWRANTFKWMFSKVLKSDVWDKEICKYDKSGLDFNMTRCLYADLSVKYGVPEFAPVFCSGDYYVFGDMDKLKFSRTQTLGEGGDKCDFRFTNS